MAFGNPRWSIGIRYTLNGETKNRSMNGINVDGREVLGKTTAIGALGYSSTQIDSFGTLYAQTANGTIQQTTATAQFEIT